MPEAYGKKPLSSTCSLRGSFLTAPPSGFDGNVLITGTWGQLLSCKAHEGLSGVLSDRERFMAQAQSGDMVTVHTADLHTGGVLSTRPPGRVKQRRQLGGELFLLHQKFRGDTALEHFGHQN